MAYLCRWGFFLASLSFQQSLNTVDGCQWGWIADDLNDSHSDGEDIGGTWACNQVISEITSAQLSIVTGSPGDEDFQPSLQKSVLSDKSVIRFVTNGATEERFNFDDPRGNYAFLHYYGTLVLLVRPTTDGLDNDHTIWGGNLNSPSANRGAMLRWRESIQGFIWDYRTSSGAGAAATEPSTTSPEDNWYLLFCETDFNDSPDAVKIYQGSTLTASSSSIVNAAESGDAQVDADIGTYPNGTQWGINGDIAFILGYNVILSSDEKATIIAAVNSYYGTSFT